MNAEMRRCAASVVSDLLSLPQKVSGIMAKIAILGYGTVGGGVAQVLDENAAVIASRLGGETVEVKYILDLRDFPGDPNADKVIHDFNVIVNDPEISIVAEMMGGCHPAYEFSSAALCAGKSVVTSNKELVANFGVALLTQAAEHGVRYLFEASVGGGIPIISAIENSMTGNEIYEIDGIVNGTTNYILTQMFECGKSFDDALNDARAKGYAEANPASDVEGIDACRKICILGAMAFGALVPPEQVYTRGITAVTQADVERAAAMDCTIKLIARCVKLNNGKIHYSVQPFMVHRSHPLANISDVFNGILIRGNAVGDVLLYGAGAGRKPTASAVVSDIVDIVRHHGEGNHTILWHSDTEICTDALTPEADAEMRATLGFPLFA